MQKIFLKSCMYICILLLSCNVCGMKLLDSSDRLTFIKAMEKPDTAKAMFTRITQFKPEQQKYALDQLSIHNILIDDLRDNSFLRCENIFIGITELNDEMQEYALKTIKINTFFGEAVRLDCSYQNIFSGINHLKPKMQKYVLDQITIYEIIPDKTLVIFFSCLGKIFDGIRKLNNDKMQKYALEKLKIDEVFKIVDTLVTKKQYTYEIIFTGLSMFKPEMQEYILKKSKIKKLLYDYRKNEKFMADFFAGVNKLDIEVQEYILNCVDIQSVFTRLIRDYIKDSEMDNDTHKSYNLRGIFIGIVHLDLRMQKYALDQIDIQKALTYYFTLWGDKYGTTVYSEVFSYMKLLNPETQKHFLDQINIDNFLMIATMFPESSRCESFILDEIKKLASNTQQEGFCNQITRSWENYNYNKTASLQGFIFSINFNTNANRIIAIFTEMTGITPLKQQCVFLDQIKIGNILMASAYYGECGIFIEIIEQIGLINNPELKEYIFNQIDIYAALNLISRKYAYGIEEKVKYGFFKIIRLAKKVFPDSIPSSEITLFSKIITPAYVNKKITLLHRLVTNPAIITTEMFNKLENDPQEVNNYMSCLLPSLVDALVETSNYCNFNEGETTNQTMFMLIAIINQIVLCPNKNDVKYKLLPIIFKTLSKIIHNNKYNDCIEIYNISSLITVLNLHYDDPNVLMLIQQLRTEISEIDELQQRPALIKYLKEASGALQNSQKNVNLNQTITLKFQEIKNDVVTKRQKLNLQKKPFLVQQLPLNILNSQGGQ